MASPRPVSGEPIASLWGQEVHDAAVVAKGVQTSSVTFTGVAANTKMPIDTFVAGDASMVDLATDEFIAPVAGLYELSASVSCSGYTGGATGAAYRLGIMKNGVGVWPFSVPTWTTNGVSGAVHALLPLAAGDRVSVNTISVPAGSKAALSFCLFVLRAQGIG